MEPLDPRPTHNAVRQIPDSSLPSQPNPARPGLEVLYSLCSGAFPTQPEMVSTNNREQKGTQQSEPPTPSQRVHTSGTPQQGTSQTRVSDLMRSSYQYSGAGAAQTNASIFAGPPTGQPAPPTELVQNSQQQPRPYPDSRMLYRFLIKYRVAPRSNIPAAFIGTGIIELPSTANFEVFRQAILSTGDSHLFNLRERIADFAEVNNGMRFERVFVHWDYGQAPGNCGYDEWVTNTEEMNRVLSVMMRRGCRDYFVAYYGDTGERGVQRDGLPKPRVDKRERNVSGPEYTGGA